MKLSAVGVANHFTSFFTAALHLASTFDEKLELGTSVINSNSGNQFYAVLQDRNPDSNAIKKINLLTWCPLQPELEHFTVRPSR